MCCKNRDLFFQKEGKVNFFIGICYENVMICRDIFCKNFLREKKKIRDKDEYGGNYQ